MRRIAVGICLAVLCFLPFPDLTGDETPYEQLYYRDIADPSGVASILRNLALRRKADTVLVVFDTITFTPPPGTHEFSSFHDYAADRSGWLDALDSLSLPDGMTFHAATTISTRVSRVGAPQWRKAVLAALERPWWSWKGFRGFEPAGAWITRLLGSAPGRRKMLVLVTGDMLPEAWARHPPLSIVPEPWRRKLLDPGKYWDEETVGSLVARLGATLDVVAPEARFGDFLPLCDIPEVPWATRPAILSGFEAPKVSEDARGKALEEARKRLLDELRKLFPDLTEEGLRAKLDEIMPPGSALPEVVPSMYTSRFIARTPYFAPHFGGYIFLNTDCPSRYGYWPLARAASAASGCYLFYPFPASTFLDVCPFDPALIRALAPETGTRADFVKAKSRDAALAALIKASRLVMEKTPWSDGFPWAGVGRRASGWMGLASVQPARREKRYRERNKPFDWVGSGINSFAVWKRYGLKLANVLPRYDQAISILREAEQKIARGEGEKAHRRSMANLRLGRFWLEMSAFHLHALSLYLAELEKHIVKEVVDGNRNLSIAYLPTIRMSDCLPAYDGTSIPADEDRRLQEILKEAVDVLQPPPPKRQGNHLPLSMENPLYRALRHPREVLKNLDPRLLPRALRMIDAASDVMRYEGESPWGWMVYYSEALTFELSPTSPATPLSDRPGLDEPDGTTTPRPRPKAKGPGSGG